MRGQSAEGLGKKRGEEAKEEIEGELGFFRFPLSQQLFRWKVKTDHS